MTKNRSRWPDGLRELAPSLALEILLLLMGLKGARAPHHHLAATTPGPAALWPAPASAHSLRPSLRPGCPQRHPPTPPCFLPAVS